MKKNSIWIAGKFRLVHKGHIDMLKQASIYAKFINIAIVTSQNQKRILTPLQTKKVWTKILEELNIKANIYILDLEDINKVAVPNNYKYDNFIYKWEKTLLKIDPACEYIIDSKEVYGNILLNVIKITPKWPDLSVTKILETPKLHKEYLNKYSLYVV